VISNSLLHHLADPQVLWRTVVDCAEPGAAVFIMDLRRPDAREQAGRLVQEYSGNEPEVLRRDFFNSLLAAYRLEEIAAQLARVNLSCLQVEAVGDRHVVVHGHLPS
jgi:2-polyprenyl-3-methyl-5-hydroxy-6-metoxy-1,4-benzoquinol methylase